MEVDSFLASLQKDYKTSLTALALLFPLSYADCWKLSESFKHTEFPQQLILAAAIAVGLLVCGQTLAIILDCLNWDGKPDLHIYPIIFCPAFCSLLTIGGVLRSVFQFGLMAVAFGLICIATRLMRILHACHHNRGKSSHENSEKQ